MSLSHIVVPVSITEDSFSEEIYNHRPMPDNHKLLLHIFVNCLFGLLNWEKPKQAHVESDQILLFKSNIELMHES